MAKKNENAQNVENVLKVNIEEAIILISSQYGCSVESVRKLIDLTNENAKVRFVSIKGYNSDKSLNTEVANHIVNINANYGKTLEKALIELNSDDKMIKDEFLIWLENWDYEKKYNLDGVPLPIFKKNVKESFEIALEEMRNPKTGSKVSNDFWLNDALVFNTNTLRLAVFGSSISKSVSQEGVFKLVKSAPLTVAKQIINYVVKPHTDKIRRFTLDNLNGLKMDGETLEIGGGQKEGVEING